MLMQTENSTTVAQTSNNENNEIANTDLIAA